MKRTTQPELLTPAIPRRVAIKRVARGAKGVWQDCHTPSRIFLGRWPQPYRVEIAIGAMNSLTNITVA
jgi:hypothetical protein